MYTTPPRFCFILLTFSFACQTNKDVKPETDSAQDDSSPAELSDCETLLPALPWGQGAPIESLEGIEDELAALDLSQMSYPVDISDLIPLYRGYVAYALEISPTEIGDSISLEQAEAAGELGQVVLGSLLLGEDTLLGIDFDFFRRGFYRYYTCSRAFPKTLDAFEEVYGSYDSSNGNIVDSIAKCGDRNLIIFPDSGVYIAESVTEGPVRETEILLQGYRNDGQLEFLVYDEEGMLTTRSQFPTLNNGQHLVTSSPYACMTCHLNTTSSSLAWGFDLLMPTTGPCL